MSKIDVKRVQASATIANKEPHWEAVVDYGGFEVQLPLPERCLLSDDAETQRRQSVLAMESLAEALLRFADQTRKGWPNDWD